MLLAFIIHVYSDVAIEPFDMLINMMFCIHD
jgi:hypothetical protein